ncbi:hypothetical protein SAY86_010745 [Trapa natans]|uniref:DUF632 domain-containing protein n=1 Tax=Trapa natans TaxID=22666 RepID=A0AAN7LHP3_TRANT|nr:hypothetical protein SAY86_010745 [Trapa natans]
MHELTKTDKTRSTVEALWSEIAFKQQSIGRTCTSILTLLDEDLYPQVLALISGLVHMWRTMHECHQVQMQISQQLNCISVDQITDLNSDYHRRAAVQLEAEVESWYRSFCCLIKSQKDYVKTLYGWVQLTNSLTDDQQQRQSSSSSALQRLCDQWLHHLEGAPFQVAWEAIKGLLSAVHSVILQQAQEVDLKKRSDKLEKRLQKELHSLDEMEKRHEAGGHSRASTGTVDGTNSEVLSPKHPLSLKRAKAESLKILAEDGKARYAHSVQVTKAMVLNNLKTALPNSFRALMEFSGSSAKALEAICGHDKAF